MSEQIIGASSKDLALCFLWSAESALGSLIPWRLVAQREYRWSRPSREIRRSAAFMVQRSDRLRPYRMGRSARGGSG